MNRFIFVLLIGATFILSGCGAQMFAAKTMVSYETADGKKLSYESDKEQIGLDATYDPETGEFHVVVEKSGTQEAIIAAVLEQNKLLIEQILPLLRAGAPGP